MSGTVPEVPDACDDQLRALFSWMPPRPATWRPSVLAPLERLDEAIVDRSGTAIAAQPGGRSGVARSEAASTADKSLRRGRAADDVRALPGRIFRLLS
jgi:hypothetical protein